MSITADPAPANSTPSIRVGRGAVSLEKTREVLDSLHLPYLTDLERLLQRCGATSYGVFVNDTLSGLAVFDTRALHFGGDAISLAIVAELMALPEAVDPQTTLGLIVNSLQSYLASTATPHQRPAHLLAVPYTQAKVQEAAAGLYSPSRATTRDFPPSSHRLFNLD